METPVVDVIVGAVVTKTFAVAASVPSPTKVA